MSHIFFTSTGGNAASADSEAIPNGHYLGVTNMTDRVVNVTLTTSGTLSDNADDTFNNIADVVLSNSGTAVEMKLPAGASYFMRNQSGGTVEVDIAANAATFAHTVVGIESQRIGFWAV